MVSVPIDGRADTEALEGWREGPVSIGEVDTGRVPLMATRLAVPMTPEDRLNSPIDVGIAAEKYSCMDTINTKSL